MAPKALTDCPENLREAIDWLVQVQHCDGVSTVSDALATLFNNVAQDAEKSLSSLPDPDRPSARDVVSKLRAFQSTLPKDSANPNENIIHNLCASAGSLLGYRSPGTYDGSGIVYGNASRLCDAILSFLYAVVSDVRDNQPYVAGRDVLHDVVVELKSQLWRGHKGFCQVIPKVANGLRRYNAAVTASNERVKKPIETVLEYVKTDGELRRGINNLQISEASTPAEDEQIVESAVSLVEQCKEVAKVFSKSLTAANDAINDINPKLKRKLENARRSFFNHVDWLSKWSKKGQKKRLDKMIQKIKSRLRRLAKDVKDKIKQEVHTVVELLKERVREIKMKLEGVAASLEEYVKELGTWMGDAKKYIKQVREYVNDIMEQLDGKHRQAIDQAAAEIDSELGKKVEELNGWIETADAAVNVAKEKAEDVFKRLDKNSSTKIGKGIDKINKAVDAVSGVNTQLLSVHNDLSNWKNAAKSVLSNAAAKAGEVSEQLDPTGQDGSHAIGKNLKDIETAEKAISSANEQLKNEVDKLQVWISDADRIREQAQKKAQEVYDTLSVHEQLSEKIGEIVEANETIKAVNSGLSNVDKGLEDWNKDVGNVIKAVVDKAKQVYDKLGHGDGQQLISQSIKQIKNASEHVNRVEDGLRSVNTDLQRWRETAKVVLDIAVEKAEEVHELLDPTKVDENHQIGKNIKNIDDAKNDIEKANTALGEQVKLLNKWIETAENIRQKAEEKAKEAYDKLSVHEELSKNVKKIVEAKEKIEGVNKNVTVQLGNLKQWNEKANRVLERAIGNAQEVYDKLKENVYKKIDEIQQDNNEIMTASKSLENEVQHLGNWRDAAGKVIDKAKDKCDDILKRVDINHKDNEGGKKGPVILTEASKLKERGTELLDAAAKAKKAVEQRVESALEAVKNMDSDLKKDLKGVKDKINKGIKDVINALEVEKLDEKVKEDLQKLRGNIEGLKDKVDKRNGDSLVKKELDALATEKRKMDDAKQKIVQNLTGMEKTFKGSIKEPLNEKVEQVTQAIGKLYNTVSGTTNGNGKEIKNVIDHIKDKVGDILKGEKPAEKKGLQGIANGLVDSYAKTFRDNFESIVGGWLDDILGRKSEKVKRNENLKEWLQEYVKNGRNGSRGGDLKIDEGLSTAIIKEFKTKLTAEISAAGQAVANGIQNANGNGSKITKTVSAVKEGCETFVNGLDEKFKANGGLVSVAQQIQVHQSGGNYEAQNFLKEITLISLRAVTSQVADEIESILLGRYRVGDKNNGGQTSIAEELDRVIGVTQGLNDNLVRATPQLGSGANPANGTAQAVDKAIKGVKTEVDGIGNKFETHVKKPVEEAVKDLDTAVEAYDNQAKEQVKKAAKAAITAAANVVSKSDAPNQMDLEHTMKNFHNSHKEITNNLEKDLREKVNTHIGKDVSTGGTTSLNAERVTLSDEFTNYTRHISQHVNASNGPKGQLPQAIMEIRSEGLKELKNVVDDNTMNTESFTGPFGKISKGLDEIAGLITHSGFFGNHQKGVKSVLAELKNGLTTPVPGIFENGLDAIKTAIDDLRKGTFGTKPTEIEEAVKVIKTQVEELRTKLKSDDNDDVINALKHLKDAGLVSGKWHGKGGVTLDGLGQIEVYLRKQNEDLGKQPGIIDEAIDSIKYELFQTGIRLDHKNDTDDVIDQLNWLKRKIGISEAKSGNLLNIRDAIKKLRDGAFKKKYREIGVAVSVFRGKLGVLRGVLHGTKDNDVIETLKDVRDVGLSKDLWKKYENKKGLEAIEQEIKFQLSELSAQPEKMYSGVNLITKELESVRNALKDLNGYPNDDVINKLEYLISSGFNSVEWNNGAGKRVAGLEQIQDGVKWQNTQLSAVSKKIEVSTKTVMKETQDMLKKVRQKLSDKLMDDDILDNLRMLQAKINLNQGKDESLQAIQSDISWLQGDALTNKPKEIGKAKQAIDTELRKLQGDLQSEVSSKLTDLVKNGFGSSNKWNGHNAKGFDHIKNDLINQHTTLSQQPEKIDLGMKEITDELKSLRAVLQGTADDNPENRGVIHNLEFMTKHIGITDNDGLKKIKSDLDSVKISQVPVITQNLNTMSLNITNAAGQLGLNLNQLENPHIDVKLRGIETGLNNLRLTDLAAAIKLCDDFLIKADEIEKNTIDALWKHVDDEVGDAIEDLTKDARQHYVDSVKEALELFARKVNEDLEQLPGDINHDMTIGFKGFMNTVEGEKGFKITKLMCVVSRELNLLSAAFASFFGAVNDYVRKEITRLHDEQNKERNPLLPPTAETYTPKLNDVYVALTELLVYFRDNDGGADKLSELVERLTKALGNLVPSDFKHPSTPLLDTVARGLTKFAGEFGNTYISAYSGQRCREEHAHKYAKVLLSIIPMMHQGLTKLAKKCEGEWKHLHITEFTADDRDNALGNYLTRCGYMVSSNESGQDGELDNMFTGAGIKELLTTPTESVDIEMTVGGEQIKNGINMVTVVAFLYNVLCHYLQACHIPVPLDPRYPCTVRDMLSWLSGLQYTRVADKLPGHCKALLNRRCHDGDTPNKEDPVIAKCIGELPSTIARTCSHSTALLTAIQGHGHGFDLAAYPYSVDFSNNRAKLHYPSDPAELLDMLRQIVCRLSKVLYFLYSQCCRSTSRVKGWRECSYGRQVPSHHWQCGQFHRDSTNSATTSTTTTTVATMNTTSSTTMHGCPPTSPLQSFLSDSCHGLLPHTLTAADMKIECANCTSNQPGQQCLTPLGFWDLGFAASVSGTGWDLAKRLGDMCRDADSCVFVLCRTLFLVCPTAPSSLGDVFALYAQVLREWAPHDRVNHRGGTYTDASDFISHLNTDGINSLFPLWTQLHGRYDNHKLTNAIASLGGHDHKSHDALSTLFYDSTCKPPSNCAPYLQPLGLHAHHNYPRKHAGLYITWIMYLAWQFWELLTHLLHALDNIDCTASSCATCPCQPGTHGEDTCQCPSIIQCAGILPTLYRYGFTYRNANLLVTGNYAMRCGDLNAQLKEALHSGHFTELFRQIDQLMWHIRMPFLYFLIALWSLVALYLLHTFLYRMDILRIRSHLLTTKASHLIDVKALLIPSRKMLSLYDASYFDDDPSELLDAT